MTQNKIKKFKTIESVHHVLHRFKNLDMEEIAWDVIEQVFTQTVKESGISDYNLQQVIFSNIKKELTSQIEESLGRNVESMTREELKDIIRKAIDKVKKQHATSEAI